MGGLLSLARPVNATMSAVGVVIGGIVAVGPEAWQASLLPLLLAALAAASFTAGGNGLNDIYDRETDRTNHPNRPIPSGTVSVREAWTFVGVAFGAAFVLAGLARLECLAVVAVNAVLMLSYESRFKARGSSGNLVIAALVGSLFLFAGLATWAGRAVPLQRGAVLAALAFLATVGREITKDIEDMAGDLDRRTLPQRIGATRAGELAAIAFAAGVALSVLPWWSGILEWPYALLVLPADGMFIYAASHSAKNPSRSQRVAKAAMVVALLAFLAGGLYEGLRVLA